MSASNIKQQLIAMGNPQKAEHAKYFFKTGKGQYGENDIFVGCTNPEVRKVASANKALSFAELKKLITDEIHECRLTAIVILTEQFRKAKDAKRKEIVDFYLEHTAGINNWDLVDLSAYKILGEWLTDKERNILYDLAKSENMWKQRIAIIATKAFIQNNDFVDTIKLAKLFLSHKHDLMHKATGWMLREVGKKDEKMLTDFLELHHKTMPRTMLRYSIEKLNPEQREYYMKR